MGGVGYGPPSSSSRTGGRLDSYAVGSLVCVHPVKVQVVTAAKRSRLTNDMTIFIDILLDSRQLVSKIEAGIP